MTKSNKELMGKALVSRFCKHFRKKSARKLATTHLGSRLQGEGYFHNLRISTRTGNVILYDTSPDCNVGQNQDYNNQFGVSWSTLLDVDRSSTLYTQVDNHIRDRVTERRADAKELASQLLGEVEYNRLLANNRSRKVIPFNSQWDLTFESENFIETWAKGPTILARLIPHTNKNSSDLDQVARSFNCLKVQDRIGSDVRVRKLFQNVFGPVHKAQISPRLGNKYFYYNYPRMLLDYQRMLYLTLNNLGDVAVQFSTGLVIAPTPNPSIPIPITTELMYKNVLPKLQDMKLPPW